jgi:hypothetical protein
MTWIYFNSAEGGHSSGSSEYSVYSAWTAVSNPTIVFIVAWSSVTIGAYWIADRIYWTLWYSSWLHFTVHSYTLVSTITSSLPLLGSASNGGRSPSSGFPNCPRPQLPASHSNSSQRLNLSGPLTHWLTDWLTQSLANLLTQLSWLHSAQSESEPELLYDWRLPLISSCWRQAASESRPAF